MHMVTKYHVRYVIPWISASKVELPIHLQVKFGPLRCDGIGSSDGETVEHLWSFLRPFKKMRKETRPSHRVDILTHALMYYGIKNKEETW